MCDIDEFMAVDKSLLLLSSLLLPIWNEYHLVEANEIIGRPLPIPVESVWNTGEKRFARIDGLPGKSAGFRRIRDGVFGEFVTRCTRYTRTVLDVVSFDLANYQLS